MSSFNLKGKEVIFWKVERKRSKSQSLRLGSRYRSEIHLDFRNLRVRAFGFKDNKTINDGGITVEFWIIKVHTSNLSSNSWGSSNS